MGYDLITHNYEILDFEQIRLEQEDKFNLAATTRKCDLEKRKEIIWSSDNKEVVTVNKKGIVSAIGQGEAVVTATLGKKSEQCLFWVVKKEFPFRDVKEGDWYYEAVDFMRSNQLMRGKSSRIFAPVETVSRAQFIVIVHRLEDCPKVSFSEKFTDVGIEEWYAQAVMWADQAGILEDDTVKNRKKNVKDNKNSAEQIKFGPTNNITREQMAMMLYGYAKYKQYDISESAVLDSFKDASQVSKEAKKAMQWAVGSGLLTGKENGTLLSPKGEALRCECATIIMRFVKKYQD